MTSTRVPSATFGQSHLDGARARRQLAGPGEAPTDDEPARRVEFLIVAADLGLVDVDGKLAARVGLKVNGKLFAMTSRGSLVVKEPAASAAGQPRPRSGSARVARSATSEKAPSATPRTSRNRNPVRRAGGVVLVAHSQREALRWHSHALLPSKGLTRTALSS
jgi:hypothetical protein